MDFIREARRLKANKYSPARTRGHQFIKAAITAVLGIGVLLF